MDLLQSQLPESLTEAVARGARVVESPSPLGSTFYMSFVKKEDNLAF